MAKSNIHKIGQWDKVRFLINNLKRECLLAQRLSLERFGLKVEEIATGHINKQDLPWHPLNADYLKQKIEEGGSELILVDTSSYFQGITSYVRASVVYAGVKKSTINKDDELVSDYARLLEFGSKSQNLPERPLWRPSLKEAVLWHVKLNEPEKILTNNLKRKYGI